MIGGASGCGLCPWSSSRKVGAYAYNNIFMAIAIVIDSSLPFCHYSR